MITTQDIGSIVRKKRKELGLTQVKLAWLSNVGVRFISELERGKETCEFYKVLKVLHNLGVKFEIK